MAAKKLSKTDVREVTKAVRGLTRLWKRDDVSLDDKLGITLRAIFDPEDLEPPPSRRRTEEDTAARLLYKYSVDPDFRDDPKPDLSEVPARRRKALMEEIVFARKLGRALRHRKRRKKS